MGFRIMGMEVKLAYDFDRDQYTGPLFIESIFGGVLISVSAIMSYPSQKEEMHVHLSFGICGDTVGRNIYLQNDEQIEFEFNHNKGVGRIFGDGLPRIAFVLLGDYLNYKLLSSE